MPNHENTPKNPGERNEAPRNHLLASDVARKFGAAITTTISPASDQDGFDGGWIVATGPDSWQWFATLEEARNAEVSNREEL